MKIDILLTIVVGVILVAFIVVDRTMVASFTGTFKTLERQRIITSNKLASAKIVYENLNHVRELVQKNMIFPNQKDSVSHESIFFDFVTSCVNDLKMKLVSCKPAPPLLAGAITTFGYDLELEGDFFSFGELCAKFENSRRIIAITSFDVTLYTTDSGGMEGYQQATTLAGNKGIRIKMHVNTYRIKKENTND
jgi:hypothetical protein